MDWWRWISRWRFLSSACAQCPACRPWWPSSPRTFRGFQTGASRCCWDRDRSTWRTRRMKRLPRAKSSKPSSCMSRLRNACSREPAWPRTGAHGLNSEVCSAFSHDSRIRPLLCWTCNLPPPISSRGQIVYDDNDCRSHGSGDSCHSGAHPTTCLVLEAAIRYGVFDQLDKGPTNLDQLAQATGTSKRGLAAIANVLVGLNFL